MPGIRRLLHLVRALVTPATKTIAYVLLFGGVFLALRQLANWESEGDYVGSMGFGLWLGVASFVIVVFVGNFVAGLSDLSSLMRLSPASSRVKSSNIALAVGLGVLVWWLLRMGDAEAFDVPLEHWDDLRNIVFGVGLLSAAPRVAAVWTAHDTLARSGRVARDADQPPGTVADVTLMADLHRHIEKSIVGLSVVVFGAMITAGALRESLVPEEITAEEFPPEAIIGYGVFFAAIIGIALVPLLLSWRERAQGVVAALDNAASGASPTDDASSATQAPTGATDLELQRSKLDAALTSESSLFRSPLVLVSVLTPLLTSAVTTLVPQLGA